MSNKKEPILITEQCKNCGKEIKGGKSIKWCHKDGLYHCNLYADPKE